MDGILLILLLIFYIFLAVALKSLYDYSQQKRVLKVHLQDISDQDKPFFSQELTNKNEKMWGRVFKFSDDFSTLGHRINFFSESVDVERWLMQAGYPLNLNVERFQGLKIFFMLVGFVFGVFAFVLGLPFGQFILILAPIGGYFSAIWWLKDKAKSRQAELGYALPDFLDTVSVTLQAGINLDQALREISPYFKGPIHEEFNRFNQKISLGVPREQAYHELLRRNESPEFQKLIKELIQGSQLGVPVATTFKTQAEDMRKIKKEKVKEQASKASPKITLITTFVVLPTAMILIGGLMVLNVLMGDSGVFTMFS